MSEDRAAKSGVEFFGDRCATRLTTALEHQRFETSLGKIEGCDQSIVATSNDDDVALIGHRLGRSLVFKNFQRRQPPRSAHDPAARMSR